MRLSAQNGYNSRKTRKYTLKELATEAARSFDVLINIFKLCADLLAGRFISGRSTPRFAGVSAAPCAVDYFQRIISQQ